MRTLSRAVVVLFVAVGADAAVPRAEAAGKVTFLSDYGVDHIDPGRTYYTFGYMVEYAINRSLYGFRPGDTEPVPDLASGPPEIAGDSRSVTVRLRPGVRFSPPVHREVTSADVKYAVQRAFTESVSNGYVFTYFADIVGAPKRHTRSLPALRGIETPDALTLVFRLRAPVAPVVAAALVQPITMPVPREYAEPFDRKRESRYNENVAFTGPYMVENDERGKLVGWERGRHIRLVRNPNWDPATDYRPASLDSILIDERPGDNPARRALRGSRLLCCDAGQPPEDVLRKALRETPSQLGRASGGGTRWIALNTKVEPFDDINVRRGVLAAFNRYALRKARGGALAGPIAQHFLPSEIPGFAESGGSKGFTEFDFMRHPRGNLALARAYMRKAGYRDGRYSGRRRLLTIAPDEGPALAVARVAAKQLRRLGFRLRFKAVPQDTLYEEFCGVPGSRAAVCTSVGWFKDFLDPEPLLRPVFDGDLIGPPRHNNWSQLDVPQINKAIDSARLVQGPNRPRAWARVNRLVVGQAAAIPYLWDHNYAVASKDLNAAISPYTSTWDLSFTKLADQ